MISPTAAEEWERALRQGAADLGLPLPGPALDRFRRHLALLLQHRLRAGLTAITDPVDLAIKHYLDSLSALLVDGPAPGEQAADIGSGGGFPGLVLALVRPQTHFALIDSSTRRADFLRLAARELEAENVEVVPTRAEAVGRDPAHRERYDFVASRAVADLPVLLEYGLPLTRVGGRLLAMKGPAGEAELARSQSALAVLGGQVETTRHLSLPRDLGRRTLILVRKTAPTPARYPRRPGIPAKRPLQ